MRLTLIKVVHQKENENETKDLRLTLARVVHQKGNENETIKYSTFVSDTHQYVREGSTLKNEKNCDYDN